MARRDGVLLVGHGSRADAGRLEMVALAEQTASAWAGTPVELGFLELSQPPAGAALDRLVGAGCDRIAVVPLMLHAAGHSKSDVPAVVLQGRARHPGVQLRYARPFGVDGRLVALAADRIKAAGGGGAALAMVGRGTSDPDANAETYKAARLLAEAVGARLFDVGFSGVTWPTVPESLERLVRLGADRIVGFSWFLATGVLVDRAAGQLVALADRTGLDVVDAGWFGPDPTLVELVRDRATEALTGSVAMSCDTCVHRAPFPGQENKVGQPLGVGHSHLAAEHRSHPHEHGEHQH